MLEKKGQRFGTPAHPAAQEGEDGGGDDIGDGPARLGAARRAAVLDDTHGGLHNHQLDRRRLYLGAQRARARLRRHRTRRASSGMGVDEGGKPTATRSIGGYLI